MAEKTVSSPSVSDIPSGPLNATEQRELLMLLRTQQDRVSYEYEHTQVNRIRLNAAGPNIQDNNLSGVSDGPITWVVRRLWRSLDDPGTRALRESREATEPQK